MNIPEHPSWQILDSTKLNSYMECPRSYFYEYILGWRAEAPNLHLEFGKAWHLAMEHLILNGYESQSVIDAYTKMTEHYRQFFPEVMDEVNSPKNPGNALKALLGYCVTYKDDQFKPLYTEIAGTVPIDEANILHFRMDSILEYPDGMIRSMEHKTGSTLSRQWTDQWSLSIQTFIYNHVLHCLYPAEKVWGVDINGVFFQKKEIKYQRVPARRSLEMMQASYWNVLHMMKMVKWDMDNLVLASDNDKVMMCFPMNPTNCTKYFGCKYHDFCMSWPNPLQRCEEVPYGMKIEYWDPSAEEAKHTFKL